MRLHVHRGLLRIGAVGREARWLKMGDGVQRRQRAIMHLRGTFRNVAQRRGL
jgi:hypothetical protein